MNTLQYLQHYTGTRRDDYIRNDVYIMMLLLIFSIFALYTNSIYLLIPISICIPVIALRVFRRLTHGFKGRECGITYSNDRLEVRIESENKNLSDLNIDKCEFQESSGILYIFCKRNKKDIAIMLGVDKEEDVKDFSTYVNHSITYV